MCTSVDGEKRRSGSISFTFNWIFHYEKASPAFFIAFPGEKVPVNLLRGAGRRTSKITQNKLFQSVAKLFRFFFATANNCSWPQSRPFFMGGFAERKRKVFAWNMMNKFTSRVGKCDKCDMNRQCLQLRLKGSMRGWTWKQFVRGGQ